MIGNANEQTIWEGKGESLTGLATGGRAAPSYRLTQYHLFWETGVLSTNAQQVALALVGDVDVKASMTQKARGVGNVIVHAGPQSVTLENVRDARGVKDLILQAVYSLRAEHQRAANTHTYNTVNQAPIPQPSAGVDVMAQIRQLSELRDAGALSDAEFETKKAELLSRL